MKKNESESIKKFKQEIIEENKKRKKLIESKQISEEQYVYKTYTEKG